ncbi:hypothetical protein Slin14017_G111170 [Septoria linicola]|nr:hypothetical protein Slin14017_G111170 [Septoria linicola]
MNLGILPERAKASETTDEVGTHLRNITCTFINAINRRKLSSDSVPWTHMSDRFQAEPDLITQSGILDLQKYLTSLEDIIATHPSYHVRILDMVTYVQDESGRAEVVFNMEVSGIVFAATAESIVRQATGVVAFEETDGKWSCVSYKGFRGMGNVP